MEDIVYHKMNNWSHVIPRDDLIEHTTDGLECPCSPTIEIESEMVIHNAMDRREEFE